MTDNATPRDAALEPPAPGAEPDRASGSPGEPAAGGGAAPPPDGGQAGVPGYRPSYVFLGIVSFISLAADLGTKWWAKDRLEPRPFTGDLEVVRPLGLRKIEVIKDHVNLIFAKNHGGAWGILGDESEAIRRPFFLLISVAAVVFIFSLYRKLHPAQRALKWGLPLVLGGALGNFVDRVRYGFVVDFIQIRLTPTFVWPTFNVADIAIVVGVGLMAIDMFVPRRPDIAPEKPSGGSGEKAPAGEG
jgi:signal peptidase II